jgi:hypothetical protein
LAFVLFGVAVIRWPMAGCICVFSDTIMGYFKLFGRMDSKNLRKGEASSTKSIGLKFFRACFSSGEHAYFSFHFFVCARVLFYTIE